jgi:hypothetical protein
VDWFDIEFDFESDSFFSLPSLALATTTESITTSANAVERLPIVNAMAAVGTEFTMFELARPSPPTVPNIPQKNK